MLEDLHNKKILIVEDASMVALHIKKSLEAVGYTIPPTFSKGEEVIDYIKAHSDVDLILMDIMLDGEMDGITTAEEIKKITEISIIYLTALTDKSSIERAKVTEPFGYIMKPFNEKELHTNIEMAIHKIEFEKKLKASEEMFSTTVQSIGDALIAMDKDFDITFANPVALHLIDKALDEVVGKSWDDVFVFWDFTGASIISLDVANIKAEQASGNEHCYVLKGKNHSHYVGDFSVSEIKDYYNRHTGYVIIFREVNARIEKAKLKQQLEKKNLASKIEGQERERLRVARDIHNGLGQILHSMKMRINKFDDIKKSDIISLLDDAIFETQRISEYLLPAKVNKYSLDEIFDEICKELNDSHSIEFSFHADNKIEGIDENTKINLFRIGQEAINNAIKHAECNTISITIKQGLNDIQLRIQDNGHGFDFETIKENATYYGKGLHNLMDRIKIMDGSIQIDSNQENGTAISVTIPVVYQNVNAN